MSKIIKINESQRSRLFEAYREGFSFEVLSSLGNEPNGGEKQFSYCEKWLGGADSYGSSRCVFTLSDGIILKLAISDNYEAGKAQNRLEYETYMKYKSPMIARVFDCDENFTYLVCENVVPCEEEDFEEILGIPFLNWDEIGAKSPSINDCLVWIELNYVLDEPYPNLKIQRLIKRTPWLKNFLNFVIDSGVSDFCDTVNNFGMVNRDGNPTIVLLDTGMNLDIWEEHYNN